MQSSGGPVSSGRPGKLIEDFPDQPQLARPEDARVARQDLLDQGRSRPGQADDEDRPPSWQAEPADPEEDSRW